MNFSVSLGFELDISFCGQQFMLFFNGQSMPVCQYGKKKHSSFTSCNQYILSFFCLKQLMNTGFIMETGGLIHFLICHLHFLLCGTHFV